MLFNLEIPRRIFGLQREKDKGGREYEREGRSMDWTECMLSVNLKENI
jgi:hypothetical protein